MKCNLCDEEIGESKKDILLHLANKHEDLLFDEACELAAKAFGEWKQETY